jgi:hypothetical protein
MAMSDSTHQRLHSVVKRLPSDFEPYGQRSRDDEWGPDCSCGCRWFIPLEGELRLDWGICYNPGSPRSGLLTFEHQGCPEFEDEEKTPEPSASGEGGFGGGLSDRSAEESLLGNLRHRRPALSSLLQSSSNHWGFEDPIYRFYHQSFKVYGLQDQTRAIVNELRSLAPDRPLNEWFVAIVDGGTGKTFKPEDNSDWTRVVRPILEAFFHARFFLEMAVRYAELETPPSPLPSGYAALLYLYGLR